MKSHTALAYAACFMLGCKSTSQDSQVAHDWGQTSRGRVALDCREEPSEELPYQTYIREQLTQLAKGNPQVFKGGLDASKLCVIPIVYDAIDAGASLDGSLFINTGI